MLEAKHPPSLNGEPGAIIHLAFLVRNTAQSNRRFNSKLQLPEGWQHILTDGEFEVPAQSDHLRLVSVQIGASAPAGPMSITYTVTDQTSEQHQTHTTPVNVKAVDGLELMWQTPPSLWLFQNHPETLQAIVLNTGNTLQHLSVSLDTPSSLHDMVAAVSDEWLTLHPGDRHVLSIQVVLPERSRRFHSTARLAVVLQSDNAVYRLEHRFAEVIGDAEVDLHLRLPMQWQTGLMRTNGNWGWAQTLSGVGHLDKAKQHHLSFAVRRDGANGLIQRDNLRQVIAYEGPLAAATIGDFVMSLSPLTGTGRLGQGIAVRSGNAQHPIRVGLHTLHLNAAARQVERAIDLQTDLGTSLRHQLIFSQASGDTNADGVYHRWMSSIVRAQTERQHNWQFELANSRSDSVQKRVLTGQAWHVQGHGTLSSAGHITYRINGWHIDTDYAHPQRGTTLRYVNLNGSVRDGLRMRLHWHDRHLHRSAATSMRDQRLGVQLHQRLRRNWRAKIGHQWQTSQSGEQAPTFTHYHHVGLRHDWDKGSLSWRINWRDNETTGSTVSARYRPTQHLSLAINERRSNSPEALDSLSGTSHSLWGRWLALQWQPNAFVFVQLSYAEQRSERESLNPQITDTLRQQSHGLRARLDYSVSRHQRLWLETQRSKTAIGAWDHSIQAGWTVAWQAPIRRLRHVGSLHGTIQPTPSRPIRVHVGARSTVTDPTGHFTIPGLASGSHRVQVDHTTLPPGMIVDSPATLQAVIEGGQRNTMTIQLAPAARVRGQIVLAKSEWQRLERVPPMLITLRQNNHYRHTVSDQDGRFSFDLLTPGTWTLNIDASQWPHGYHMVAPSQTLVLDPSEQLELSLSLTPNQRTIQFIDEGSLND